MNSRYIKWKGRQQLPQKGRREPDHERSGKASRLRLGKVVQNYIKRHSPDPQWVGKAGAVVLAFWWETFDVSSVAPHDFDSKITP